jgi:hypothetical protein
MDFKCLAHIFSENSRLIAISSPLKISLSLHLGVLVTGTARQHVLHAHVFLSCRIATIFLSPRHCSRRHHSLVASALFPRRIATVFCCLSIVLSSPCYCSLVNDQYHTRTAMHSPCNGLTTLACPLVLHLQHECII